MYWISKEIEHVFRTINLLIYTKHKTSAPCQSYIEYLNIIFKYVQVFVLFGSNLKHIWPNLPVTYKFVCIYTLKNIFQKYISDYFSLKDIDWG